MYVLRVQNVNKLVKNSLIFHEAFKIQDSYQSWLPHVIAATNMLLQYQQFWNMEYFHKHTKTIPYQ